MKNKTWRFSSRSKSLYKMDITSVEQYPIADEEDGDEGTMYILLLLFQLDHRHFTFVQVMHF